MSNNNSIRICPVCKCEFKANLKRNGQLAAKQKECCTRSCAMNLRAERAGTSRMRTFTCEHCWQLISRPVRRSRDSGKFCSRSCGFSRLTMISLEKKAIERIYLNHKKNETKHIDIVANEVASLVRIKRNIINRTRKCDWCGVSFIQPRPYVRKCSSDCHTKALIYGKRRSRNTESARAARSMRKAMHRGARGFDKIDPIAVFERDDWKCHLCGILTLKDKRGTIHDRAPELEHIVAIANGGTHTWGNVACSCRKCNGKKGASDVGQLNLGFAVR